jgi:cation diffusion facilitator CzcD-associated flavoprotein CzcO
MIQHQELDVIVVGAGLAGLYQLHKLRELGLRAVIVEAADDVGGTWYWNRYPGARCDVESMYYSYSFSRELEQEWTWSEKYPTQPEILRYINNVTERFDLRSHIIFGTRVLTATYDERARRWRLTTSRGADLDAQFLIMATGCLSAAKPLELPGEDRFRGPSYHTGHWPHEGVDFTGLRVGVVGTGSSGIQIIPILAEHAAALTVFQRTPNFSMPAKNRPLSQSEVQESKRTYPALRRRQLASSFGVPVTPGTRSALEVPQQERDLTYQTAWDQGSLIALRMAYTDIGTSLAANDTAAEFVRERIREIVEDSDVAETLSPRNYPYGTKRPCLDTGYYDTFNREHVRLVDLRKTPLVEITERGLRTSEEEHELDAIVFATGFDAITGALTAIDIRGRDGISLAEKWSEGPRTYLGLAVAGFPNFFTITGPLSPSVLSNMVVSIEQHVDWITDLLATLRQRDAVEVEATATAEDYWVEHVADIGSRTLFPRAESWYLGANVPGKARVLMAYVGGIAAYRQRCDEVASENYRGFHIGSDPHAASATGTVKP